MAVNGTVSGRHLMQGTAGDDVIRASDLVAFAWQPDPGETTNFWQEAGHAIWWQESSATGRVVFEDVSADSAFTAEAAGFDFHFTSGVEVGLQDLITGGPWAWDPATGVLDPQAAGHRDFGLSNLILTADWSQEESYHDPIILYISGSREAGRWVLQQAPVAAEVLAGEGNDTVLGGDGADRILGGSGADLIEGGTGRDTIDGQLGDDLIRGGEDKDIASGGSGNDTLEGGAGNDILYGFVGDDLVDGGEGRDVMLGGTGTDTMIGGAGRDELTGGDGNDILWGDDAGDTADAAPGSPENHDTIRGEAGDDLIGLGDGDDYAIGGEGADTLYGGAGNDLLLGWDGDDLLFGGDGNDRLSGGASDLGDTMTGGAGADRFYLSAEQQGPAVITDFDAAEGDLISVQTFDATGADVTEADVTLQAVSGGVEVLVAGTVFALLQGTSIAALSEDWLLT